MGNRNKPPRLTHPLLVAASALTRATDPPKPSRLTVLRLLGDALHALQESHIRLTAIKARVDAHLSSKNGAVNPTNAQPLSRHKLEADNRFRQAHNEGARALFNVTVTALIKLPSRGGPLRRRAIDLLKLAALATGPASAMSAADRIRSHLSSLKRQSWSEVDLSDFDISAILLTLADVSTCAISSRDVARESIHFLLGQRIQQKCRPGDICYALAVILASFPQHAPPDDRLVDLVLQFVLTPTHLKQGLSMIGGPLLITVIAPFVVNRGPAAGDDIALACARTLKIAPTPTERSMWALALARAVVTARRSSTYQLRKYGTSEVGSKFPKAQGQLPKLHDNASTITSDSSASNSENDPSTWVSNEIFEESLLKVAAMSGLEQASIDAVVAIAAVLRMWLLALPSNLDAIVPRALTRLSTVVSSASDLSIIVDAVWLGILKYLKPSQSSIVFRSVIPLISDTALSFPAALSICASLIGKFGRQALSESGLSTEFSTDTSLLIKRVHDSLESSACFVRLCGVQALVSILHALPRTCSQFLTAVLQNLRIADLNIVSKPTTPTNPAGTANGLAYYDKEISPLLGNGAALSVLMEKLSISTFSIPGPLSRQCIIDVFALFRPHQASNDFNSHSPIVACVRRRVGWGIIAGFARAKRTAIFESENLEMLLNFWSEELKYGGTKSSKNLTTGTSPTSAPSSNHFHENPDLQVATVLEEAIARSSTRGAALCALSHALQNVPSPKLEQCARALGGSSAARVVSLLCNMNSSASASTSLANGAFMGFGTEHSFIADFSYGRKQGIIRFIQALAMESMHMTRVAGLAPPTGDTGELCFLVAVALAEEAQKAMGEVDADHTVNNHLTQGASSSSRAGHYDGVLSNSVESLLLLERVDFESRHATPSDYKRENVMPRDNTDSNSEYDVDASWLFSKEGLHAPLAERSLIYAGKAIAAVVSEDLSAHGSLIESLPAAKLSPSLCATISLEMTKRLSRSDLEEINRALAVLQILVRRSLEVTGGAHHSVVSQKKSNRLYTPNTSGDSRNRRSIDIPGTALQELSRSEGALSCSTAFSHDGHLAHLPFHNFHSRAAGIMHANRSLASEAFRELSITGGATLWIGLTKKVIETIRTNIEGVTPVEFITLANALTTLGALLEVIPEPGNVGGKQSPPSTSQQNKFEQSSTVNEISTKAINLMIEVIELGKSHAQAASALALSSRSYLVAASSEKLVGALLRAWANDKGNTSPMGHFGKYAEECDIWQTCFYRVWSDMGVKEPDISVRFLNHDSSGFGSISDSLAIGARNIIEACRMYWWPFSESSAGSVREFATDLVQWDGNCSHHARTAGLSSMVSIWSGRIDSAQAERSVLLVDENGAGDMKELAILPVEKFALKDPSRVASHVGPFLDEVIYKALAPVEHEFASRELRMTATFAVSEMVRGLGVSKTCENLPRLPETLFAAVEERIPGAHRVMDALVNGDADKRPRYWFGLCRAVTLGGERLNYGKKGTVWDTSFRTKAYAVRVAVGAIDCSMAAGILRRMENNTGTKPTPQKQSSAFGFLRKIFDFTKQVSSAASFDFESCGHGCRLLQRIAARIGSFAMLSGPNDNTVNDFFDMWDPCVAMMHTLLVDRVPHGVVNSASTAISELLVSCSRIGESENVSPARCSEMVSSYMEALVECDLRQRLKYADQGEDVGMRALLSLVGKYGRITSAMKANIIQKGNLENLRLPGEKLAKRMFFALCGDFVGTLSETGLQLIAKDGGALTSGMLNERELRRIMIVHIAPIVLGAICCVSGSDSHDSGEGGEISWENADSIGAKMAIANSSNEDVALACLVWLITHNHIEHLSQFKRLAFCNQVQETLQYLFLIDLPSNMHRLREEILLSFAGHSKTETLRVAETIANFKNLDAGSVDLLINLTCSILLMALEDEFGTFQERETQSLSRGLRALSNIISMETELCSNDTCKHAVQVLDVVFKMTCHPNVVTASVLREEKVLIVICETVSTCIGALEKQKHVGVKTIQMCESKVWQIFENGCKYNCLSMFTVGAALGATLSDRDGEIASDILFEMITSNQAETDVLPVVLNCHGVEDCLVGYINVMTEGRKDDAILLLNTLGAVASSDYQYSVAVAYRLSVAAVLAEGELSGIVNKMGMTLYSLYLPLLIQSLPTSGRVTTADVSPVAVESANYFLELVEDEADLPGGFISTLKESDRERAKQFLLLWVDKR